MPEQYPVNDQARTRLREAQKLESKALQAVIAARKARDRQQQRLDAANRKVDVALVELVGTSGVWRASRLTGEDVKTLQAKARAAGLKTSQIH